MSEAWTREYCGMSYFGQISDDRWAAIRTFAGRRFCVVTFWMRGCGFSPRQETFRSLKKARAAGEAWHQSKNVVVAGECPLCGHKS